MKKQLAHLYLTAVGIIAYWLSLALLLVPKPRRMRKLSEMFMAGMLPAIAGGAGGISETHSVVYVLQPKDHGGSVATGESINMGRLHTVTFVLAMGAVGTGNPALTLKSGASDGTQTTAETFRYRLADAIHKATGADGYGDWATSSSLSLVAATYAEKLLVIEIDSDQLTEGQPWLTLELSNVTAVTCSVVAIGQPRYQANDIPTVI